MMLWQTSLYAVDVTNYALIMGILNVTPDSFSDGGSFFSPYKAIERGVQMLAEGAAIIDVGGESTRPGAEAVSEEEELRRVVPVIEGLIDYEPEALISIDTSKAVVARAALERGAAIINDVTALLGDPEMAAVAAETGAGVVLMHMQGTPRTMQQNPHYQDVAAEVRAFFAERFAAALAAGIKRECILFDPGIGFGKMLEHNLTLLRDLDALSVEGRPLALGVSRKSFLARITGAEVPAERDAPTVALTALARERGARVLRVHEVRSNVAALRMTEALLGIEPPPR